MNVSFSLLLNILYPQWALREWVFQLGLELAVLGYFCTASSYFFCHPLVWKRFRVFWMSVLFHPDILAWLCYRTDGVVFGSVILCFAQGLMLPMFTRCQSHAQTTTSLPPCFAAVLKLCPFIQSLKTYCTCRRVTVLFKSISHVHLVVGYTFISI